MSQTQQIFPFHVKTNKRKKQVEPDFSKENPLRIPMFANGLNLTMDAEFQEKAAVLVFIDGIRKFDSTDEENSFKGHLKYSIPLGHELPRDKKVEVFVWNDVDDNFIECAFDLFLDEFLKPLQSESVPLGIDVFNRVVSKSEEIFPRKLYAPDEYTKLIYLGGYTRFWAILSAQDYTPPAIISNPSGFAPQGNINDGTLATKTNDKISGQVASETWFVTVDFGSLINRVPKARVALSASKSSETGNSRIDANLYVSSNGVDWSLVDTDFVSQTVLGSTGEITKNLEGLEVECRYMKIEFVTTLGLNEIYGSVTADISEIYNGNALGGTAALSFLIKDSDGNFFEAIPSSEFGTVTQGQAVTVQVGDTLTKRYFLPSSQTDFMAKLTVTGGGINTSVSIIKGS